MKILALGVIGWCCAVQAPLNGETFPSTGWMPKEEIGALKFLAERPEADGRGVVVAILDTGVDPGVEGLQRTTDGKVKVLDMIDATGSGDVRMGEPVAIAGKTIVGRTGRTLTLGDWKCPDGELRLGVFAGYEMFPWDLVDRLREDRADEWRKEQGKLERELRHRVSEWKASHPEAEGIEKRQGEDLEVLLEEAEKLGEREDPGPVYDCAVWHDGERWRAVVDTDEDGNLAEEKVLSDYGTAQEWATFGGGSMLNFGINVYDDGDVLSLVIDSGMHGTHVAGIVAAHYPESPELNGVAPGAQIVSIKIGDTRLDGMETGQALTRAALAIKRWGVDLVNMSYGEPTRKPDAGQLIRKLAELVDEDGVVFCASAGNSGPALSTVGAPGGSTESVIGVGAAITPALASHSYSLREEIATDHYTWSSRGPTKDGALGVSISAPGGAFSPVPQWGLTRSLRFNGTSMASPNACGGIALVLSGLKAEQLGYTSHWVKRAVENTAATIEGVEVFATGHGMLQVGDAFEYLKGLDERALAMPRIDVSASGRRGVYFREARDVRSPRRVKVDLKAVFPEAADGSAPVAFSLRCGMACEAAWVRVPEWCFLTGGRGQQFEIELDPTVLPPGVHSTQIIGTDADAPELGALWRIPLTVVKTEGLDGFGWEASETFGVGERRRWFFKVPEGATWATLELEADGLADPRRAVVHVQHVVEGELHRNVGKRTYVTLQPEEETEVAFDVLGGATLEVCVASYWSELGEVDVECDLKFRGLVVNGDGVATYGQGDGAVRVRAGSPLGRESIEPRVSFSRVERRLESSEVTINELTGSRDVRDDGTASFELVAVYPFSLDEDASIRVEIPALNGRIYESAFESQLTFLRDGDGRVHAVDDTYPEDWNSLSEGDWEAVLHLRGEDREALEKLKKLAVVLCFKHEAKAKVFAGFDEALTGGAGFGKAALGPGERVDAFVGEPEKIPDWVAPGDVLVGQVKWQAAGLARSGLEFVVRGADVRPEAPSSGRNLFDMKVGLLVELRQRGDLDGFDRLSAELVAEQGGDLELRREMLRRWDTTDTRAEAIEHADALLGLIDEDELARYFGRMAAVEGDEEKTLKKDSEAKRAALREALAVRVRVFAVTEGDGTAVAMRTALKRLEGWGEVPADALAAVAEREKRAGERLSLLRAALEAPGREKDRVSERIELLDSLGWEHLAARERAWVVRAFPVGGTVF